MGDAGELKEKLQKRLPRLEGYLNSKPLDTESGRVLFARQLTRQIGFFKDLIAECELAVLPEL